jgi:geranylgeranyl pyrophosphate synthase
VRPDLAAVDQAIRSGLHSVVPLVDQIADHIIGGGGKRLRPLLVVLAGRACGGAETTIACVPRLSLNSFTPPPCCMTMWSTCRPAGVVAIPPMKSMEIRPVCWSETSFIRAHSR